MSRMIRALLEQQSNLIEATLLGKGVSIRISGGAISRNKIKYQVDCSGRSDTHITELLNKIKGLNREISAALKQETKISFDGKTIIIETNNPEPKPTTLFSVMEEIKPLKYTAVLGVTEGDSPLHARMSSPLAKHILVASSNQENNSKLLRSIAVSLVLNNTPEDVKLLCSSPDKLAFDAIIETPHLVRPRIYQESLASKAIASIVKTARDKTDRNPRIVVMVDRIEKFPEITPVLNCERLHWVVSTCDKARIVEMFYAYPTKLIGKTDLEIEGVSFEETYGDRYFAICDGAPILFTVAHVGEYEARNEIRKANVQTNSTD